MIIFAQKPDQENISNTDDFIWHMCVSYRKLNSVNKIFQFHIPRYEDAVTILSWGAGKYGLYSWMPGRVTTKLMCDWWTAKTSFICS